ncbi:hypothetical protein B0T14DRAFT_570799 [Immersiella caudata]|uniref:Uncharacterized protein n=1 Tax=Immersiella caudata TaxID=314043 RepID=A0AA39TX79_9PEZI|nr:hypothetical protein B0T14DRAFT_570799 [Immersiella caudata]
MSPFSAVILSVALVLPSILAQNPIPTFIIGDLNQYNLQATPTAGGDVVIYSDAPGAGVNVMLTTGLQDKVLAATESSCQTFSNDCIKSIQGALKQNAIIDSRSLQPRQIGVGEAAAVAALASFLNEILIGHRLSSSGIIEPQRRPIGNLIPGTKLNPALANAPEVAVVTEEGKPAVTIIQNLATPTAPAGPDAPSFAFEDGDLVITLPDDLAQRADYIVTALLDCETEDITGSDGGLRLKGRDDLLQAILCGGRALLTNAGRHSPLDGFWMIGLPYLNLLSPRNIATLNGYIDWAREHGANIQVPTPQIDHLAVLTFVLAAIRARGRGLQRLNRLGADFFNAQNPTGTMPAPEITAAPSAPTSESCPLETCSVSCSLRGVIEYCETDCPESTTSSCTRTNTAEEEAFYTTTAWTDWTWPDEVYFSGPMITCGNDMSKLPWEVFKNIPAKFCAEVEANLGKEVDWLMNYKGEPIPKVQLGAVKATAPTGSERRGWLASLSNSLSWGKRAPPVDIEAYKDYHVNLLWEPKPGAQDSCISSCAEAFTRLQGSQCNPTGSSEKTMKLSGSIDNTCGVYSFRVEEPKQSTPPPPPPPPPSPRKTPRILGERVCYPKPSNHIADVHVDDVKRSAQWYAWLFPGGKWARMIKPGDDPIVEIMAPATHKGNAAMTFSLEWIKGCELEGGDGQNLGEPVPGWDGEKIFLENYEKCTGNDGSGGWIQAGCLKFDFFGHVGDP